LQVKELGMLSSTVDVKPKGTIAANVKAVLVPGHANDDCFGSKYQVYLNVSSLNACFFNFGSDLVLARVFYFRRIEVYTSLSVFLIFLVL
jgi:hypothetical protein